MQTLYSAYSYVCDLFSNTMSSNVESKKLPRVPEPSHFEYAYSEKQRRDCFESMKRKQPFLVPIILEPAYGIEQCLKQSKFMIGRNEHVKSFDTAVNNMAKNHDHLFPYQKIVIFKNKAHIDAQATVGEIYEKYKKDDGFLYLNYYIESRR